MSLLISRSSRTDEGFTLMELLLVMAIIGIIAVTMITMLKSQRERARLTAFKEQMSALTAIGATCIDSGGFLQPADDDATPICAPNGGLGNHLPASARKQCSGNGSAYTVDANPNGQGGTNQIFHGKCTFSDGSDCVADCGISGCKFSEGCE